MKKRPGDPKEPFVPVHRPRIDLNYYASSDPHPPNHRKTYGLGDLGCQTILKQLFFADFWATLPPGARAREKFIFWGFFDFWDPAPVLGVLDIVLLIPEVWDFYLLSNATFFFIIKPVIFIVFSLLSSPWYSPGSPGAPPDRKKKSFFFCNRSFSILCL